MIEARIRCNFEKDIAGGMMVRIVFSVEPLRLGLGRRVATSH